MKLKPNYVAMLGFLLFSCGFSLSLAAEETDLVSQGKALLQKNCGRCHSIDKAGESPLKKAPPLLDLYRQYQPERLEFELAEGIGSSHSAMPQIQFSVDQIEAIVAYLENLTTDN